MSFIKTLKKISVLVFTLIGAIISYLLLNRKKKEEKGGEIDREEIREDAKKRIMDTPDPDFIRQYPSVGDAGERGKARFASRVKRILHQRGGGGSDTGSDEDSGR